MRHPDDPTSNWPERMTGDLGEALSKLVSSIREDEKLIREVRDIANPIKENKELPKKL